MSDPTQFPPIDTENLNMGPPLNASQLAERQEEWRDFVVDVTDVDSFGPQLARGEWDLVLGQAIDLLQRRLVEVANNTPSSQRARKSIGTAPRSQGGPGNLVRPNATPTTDSSGLTFTVVRGTQIVATYGDNKQLQGQKVQIKSSAKMEPAYLNGAICSVRKVRGNQITVYPLAGGGTGRFPRKRRSFVVSPSLLTARKD